MDSSLWEWAGWPSDEIVSAYSQLLAALQWPLVALVLGVFFKKEIAKLLARIKQVEGLGATVSLDKELDNLQQRVEEQAPTSTTVADRTVPLDQSHDEDLGRWKSAATNLALQEREVIETIAVSPTAGVMLVSSHIESALRTIAENKGIKSDRPPSVPSLLSELRKIRFLPGEVLGNVQEFWRIRNQVVHGHDVPSQDIVRAADVGLSIYRSLGPAVHESETDAGVRERALQAN